MTTRTTFLTRAGFFGLALATATGWQLANIPDSRADSALWRSTETASTDASLSRRAAASSPARAEAGKQIEPNAPNTANEANVQRQPARARAAGAAWLIQNQNADGGWGAGNWASASGQATSDVATTAISAMALLRDDPTLATHAGAFERAVAFVVKTIDASPADGPLLQGPQGTQPQHKLGRNVDTHFASLLLGEISGEESNSKLSPALLARIGVAYDKVLTKVVAAQQADGSFDREGWAPVLSTSVAAQGLYKALENGKALPASVMEKTDNYQRALVDTETREFDATSGAGVNLYSAASSLRGNAQASKRPGSRADAAARAKEVAGDAVREDAGALLRGFGSIGGEEMLSYMMISDTLAEDGGADWKVWEQRIGRHLSSSQNSDGSWSGHHCITSTAFVTAAAVMTLGAS